ncbi:HD domain-containing protein [bacterium]|nr:HD domain-containing protein [bacterium]
MITEKDFERVLQWFDSYTSSFILEDPVDQSNIKLKIDHSYRVSNEIKDIGISIGLKREELLLCGILGLIHDAGRFEQYYKYKTFVDSKSENHAFLGKKVLEESGVLRDFSDEDRELLLFAVYHHNFKILPDSASQRNIFFTRLLRDADKLDIFRVVTEYYENHEGGANSGIELDLPVSDEISPSVLEDIINLRIVEISNLRTSTDFKILQLGWIFDINFPYTFLSIKERRYIERICATLSDSETKKHVCQIISNFIKERSGSL